MVLENVFLTGQLQTRLASCVGDAGTAHAHGDLDGCTIATVVVEAHGVALTLRNDTNGTRSLTGARVSMTCRKSPDLAFF